MATNLTDKLKEIPETAHGKAWLFWISVAAMTTGLIVSLKALKK